MPIANRCLDIVKNMSPMHIVESKTFLLYIFLFTESLFFFSIVKYIHSMVDDLAEQRTRVGCFKT